jgi:DNA-binding transcriptional regulator YiaG
MADSHSSIWAETRQARRRTKAICPLNGTARKDPVARRPNSKSLSQENGCRTGRYFSSWSNPLRIGKHTGRTLGLDPLVGDTRIPFLRVTNKRRSTVETKEIDAVVEQLRDFLRLNYMTGADVARQIGVRDSTLYSWLQGESRPSKPDRIIAFLESLPAEPHSGIAPNGYQYREYKNWRGIPRPRRCPVLQAS